MRGCRAFVVIGPLVVVAACAQGASSPLTPVASPSGATLAAPAADSPADQTALGSYRPTLVVRNGTSTGSGAKLYEFQVSDRSDFSPTAQGRVGSFAVVAHPTGVPEGAGGTTSYAVDFDLQPTTRFYWRARLLQGSDVSDWSTTRTFTTPIAGYSRPGELYDPLVSGTTVGIPVGSTTFIPGRGIVLNDGNAYVRYQLAQPLSSGEFSMEIEGLRPNGPGEKLKLFSMSDGTGDLYRSNYLFVAQYRGVNGNPDNAIAYKVLLGDPTFKLEPDFGARAAGVLFLNPSRAYYWKANWGNFFHMIVQDGRNGPTIYDQGMSLTDLGFSANAAVYNPSPHFAYLGANNGPFNEEAGSFPGTVYRNVWIGAGPRPASLGSALDVTK